ncbi:MAG TPA: pilus assembly protein PilM [Phycisphaerae bacterium]|nr:pilus assembly protein PilM [Phycisphaerae bacterium]
MWSHLLGRNRWPIGLDIGTDSIKMLQMCRVGGVITVRACRRWRFPVPADPDPRARRELAVGAVPDMLRRGGFRGNHVISSLSCGQLKIKNVRLPKLSGRELERAVHGEAHDRFGGDFAPDQLHYLRAGEIRQGMESHQEYILMGAPGEVVEDHYAMLREMGLYPEHIDVEPLAMFRPFERHLRRRADEEEVTVVVDLGHSSTKVVVARGREVVLVKKIDIGGRDFAQAVADQLHLSYEEAEDLRFQIMRERASHAREGQAGPDGEEEDPNSVRWTVLDAVRGQVEELAREVALCLRYCSVTFRGLRAKRVTMTGGQAYDPAMVRLLGEQLGVECVIGQPLRGVDTSGVDLGGDRRGMLAEWAVCAGLAFRPEESERGGRKRSHEADRLPA